MVGLKFLIVLAACCAVPSTAVSSYLTRTTASDIMKCSYGERGSLTATCFNATSTYFKETPYRFDQLDETLRCLNCTLTVLDQGTFDLSGNQIKFLVLQKSQIRTMRPKAFLGLIFMESLDLSSNTIVTIEPHTFQGVKKVKTLDLSDNLINSLSDNAFLELANLQTLQLKNNKIQDMETQCFQGLDKLESLDLTNNRLRSANIINMNMTSLKTLILRNNDIQDLTGQEFVNLTGLMELDLSFNKIKQASVVINPDMTGNKLLRLDLSHNNVQTLKAEGLSSLKNLEELDLSDNQLHEVGQRALYSLFKLVRLNLAYNKLNTLKTGTFTGLPSLASLNLSHNVLEQVIVTGVLQLHNVHILDLSGNNLTDLDFVSLINRLPKLTYLQLEGNLLPCDLEKDMEAYFTEDNFKYTLYGREIGAIKCTETEVKRTFKAVEDSLIQRAEHHGSRTAEIWIFVIITFLILLIGLLFYLQYRTYLILSHKSVRSSTSTANLVSEM